MKKSLRLVLLAGASFLGLAFAAPALASYGPSLTAEQTSYKVGAATTVDLFVFAPQNDDPTAKITIFSPAGYRSNLGTAPGTKIGHVVAIVKAKALGSALLPLAGDVVVGNPADPNIVAASTRCRTSHSPTNQAVWVLNASLQGQTISIPVFVNQAGPLVTLEVCFQSPDVPQQSGGAPFGAQLVSADFDAKGIFTNASAKGGYEWAADFTPYTAGTATPNPAGTIEWRTYLGLPQSLTFRRMKSKSSLVSFTGALSVQGLDPSNIRLRLYYGKKANPAPTATTAGDRNAKVARVKPLKSNGKYTISRPRVKARTFFQMRFENYGTKCEGPSPSGLPLPCNGEDLAPMTSAQVRVLPPKRHR